MADEDSTLGLQKDMANYKGRDSFQSPPVVKRYRLPTERSGLTHKVVIGVGSSTIKLFIQTGLYGDGKLGEVFLKADKQGTFVSGLMDTLSMMISISLQHGVPLVAIVDKMHLTRFEPQGAVKGGSVAMCTSVVDYIARWLKIKYLTEDEDGQTGSVTGRDAEEGGHGKSGGGEIEGGKAEGTYPGGDQSSDSSEVGTQADAGAEKTPREDPGK